VNLPEKIKSDNLLNVLLLVLCFVLVAGCNMFGSKTSDTTNTGSTPVSSSSPTTTVKNKAVGTWAGKAYDGKTDLKMIFTETDWTLISGTKSVMTQKYTISGDDISVQDSKGGKLPITLTLDGDELKAETDDGKTTLKRQ
jgi:hypothetical protein